MTTENPTGQQAGTGGAADMLAEQQTGVEHPAGAGNVPPAGQQVQAPWAETTDGPWKIGGQPWYSVIPEADVRSTMEAKGYKNPAEAAMAYHNLLKLQNGNPNVVALPGEDATPEQWNAFYTKLGRPETPDGYKFEFPEGQKVDDNMLAFGRRLFHELGLDNKKAQAAADKWNEFAAQEAQRLAEDWTKSNDAEVQALKGKLGDQFDAHIAAGRRVVEGAGISAETIQKVEASLGTAGVLELLGAIGMKSQEGGFVGTGTGTGAPTTPDAMSPDQAKAEIEKLNADTEFQKAYTGKNHEGHREAVERMQKLFARL